MAYYNSIETKQPEIINMQNPTENKSIANLANQPQEMTTRVQVCAMVTVGYKHTEEVNLDDTFCDIYFPEYQGCSDRSDLGADDYHYAVDGKNEMVFVDKGLLQALVDQCQRTSENEAVYDDTRNTSYQYADLNKLVVGLKFDESVTGVVEQE